jgi:hypothetical protein
LEEGWAFIFFAYYHLGRPFFIQDTQHLGAKQRTGFLKTASLGKFYPLGNYFATRVHLDELRNKVGKDKHGLRDCDVDLTDKMNYPSVERLCKQNLIDLLEQHVPGMKEC